MLTSMLSALLLSILVQTDAAIHLLEPQGDCVAIRGAATEPNTPVVLEPCNESAAQSWRFDQGKLTALGVCLNAPVNAYAGSLLVTGACDTGEVAQWVLDGLHLHLANTGHCLAIRWQIPLRGKQLSLAACDTTLLQNWVVNAVQDANAVTGAITPIANPNTCVMPQRGSDLNGTPIVLAPRDGSALQTVTYADGMLLFFDKCLTATSPSASAPVILSDCVFSAANSWNRAEGAWQLSNSNFCLDTGVSSPFSGLQVQPCNGSASQAWSWVSAF